MSKRWMIENGTYLTMNPERPIMEGYLVVQDDRIAYIGEQEPEDVKSCVERLDGRHKLFMPGLVNTHGHAAMSLLRGYADDRALQVWLEQYMWPMEAKYTADDVRWGTALSVVEMLKGGTTTFVDMYDQMDTVAQVVEQAGIRGCLTRGAIGLGSEEMRQAKLAEAIRFAREWHGQADGRITTMMSPHSPYTCPPEYIAQFVEAAHDMNLPLHTHLSETAAEVELNVQQYGQRPVAHLHQLGFFARPTILAHAVHLNDEEIEMLAACEARVSHNPGSNLKLASGIARVPDMLKRGILVSLGTDSSASNNNLDMFEEMRLAALIHKGVSGDPTVIPAAEAIRMATEYGARSLDLEQVGKLEAGMKADFIAIDIDQPHYYPQTDLLSHIVYSASVRDVTDVWVDGRRLIQNGNCLTMDEERIKREAAHCFDQLRKR